MLTAQQASITMQDVLNVQKHLNDVAKNYIDNPPPILLGPKDFKYIATTYLRLTELQAEIYFDLLVLSGETFELSFSEYVGA